MRDDVSKFVVAGDWHANNDYADTTIREVGRRGIDTVVHVGDYGYLFKKNFVKRVEKACTESGVILYFLPGNHDNYVYLNSLRRNDDGLGVVSPHVFYMPRNFRWTWSGVSMVALGGAYSLDQVYRSPYVSWWPQETISVAEATKCVADGPVDVMFTHDCPAGIDMPFHFSLPEHVERAADQHRDLLRGVVDDVKPKVLYHGHYHRRYDDVLEGEDYRTQVHGLGMDGTPFNENCMIVDLEEM